MSETIRVKVTIDTDELRKWADWHADRGHHGVAHVLYKAASDGEGLGEQAIREAKTEALTGAKAELERMLDDFPQKGRHMRARWATDLDHLCRNRACVNPYHLEPVPRRVNTMRGTSPTVVAHLAGICLKGHEMTAENTIHEPNGQRRCRRCRQASSQAAIAKRRAKRAQAKVRAS